METKRGVLIERAFEETFKTLSAKYDIAPQDLTILIGITRGPRMRFYVCRKDLAEHCINASDLCCPPMVALRFTLDELALMFQSVHQAFMQEFEAKDYGRITLILYHSYKVDCACIGILKDNKPQKALMVSEVMEAMHLGYEQLN